MKKEIGELLSFLLRPSVEYNLAQSENWGVAFGEDGIYSAAGHFMIEIKNLELSESPKTNFFSFYKNDFSEYSYPLTVAQLMQEADKQCSFVGKLTVPLSNIINRFTDLEESVSIKKCRVVISPGYIESGDMQIIFKDGVFNHPKLTKPIVVSQESEIEKSDVKNKTTYRCRIISEDDTAYYADVIEPYGKMRIGILYSEKGFIPTAQLDVDDKKPSKATPIEAVNRMIGIIPPEMIVTTNDVGMNDDAEPVPIHLDACTLSDLLKVYLLCNTDKINIFLPPDPNKPVMIVNEGDPEKDVIIRIVLATLNPFFGAQRR